MRTDTILPFSEISWRKCPPCTKETLWYNVDDSNPRIATKKSSTDPFSIEYTLIKGDTFVPFEKITVWYIRILKSRENDGKNILVGVVPHNLEQKSSNKLKSLYEYLFDSMDSGLFLNCFDSRIVDGNNTYSAEYGPRKKEGQYVHIGDVIGVMMNTTNGELSFTLGGVNLGVAPIKVCMDEPLVPCVKMYYEGDSVELIV